MAEVLSTSGFGDVLRRVREAVTGVRDSEAASYAGDGAGPRVGRSFLSDLGTGILANSSLPGVSALGKGFQYAEGRVGGNLDRLAGFRRSSADDAKVSAVANALSTLSELQSSPSDSGSASSAGGVLSSALAQELGVVPVGQSGLSAEALPVAGEMSYPPTAPATGKASVPGGSVLSGGGDFIYDRIKALRDAGGMLLDAGYPEQALEVFSSADAVEAGAAAAGEKSRQQAFENSIADRTAGVAEAEAASNRLRVGEVLAQKDIEQQKLDLQRQKFEHERESSAKAAEQAKQADRPAVFNNPDGTESVIPPVPEGADTEFSRKIAVSHADKIAPLQEKTFEDLASNNRALWRAVSGTRFSGGLAETIATGLQNLGLNDIPLFGDTKTFGQYTAASFEQIAQTISPLGSGSGVSDKDLEFAKSQLGGKASTSTLRAMLVLEAASKQGVKQLISDTRLETMDKNPSSYYNPQVYMKAALESRNYAEKVLASGETSGLKNFVNSGVFSMDDFKDEFGESRIAEGDEKAISYLALSLLKGDKDTFRKFTGSDKNLYDFTVSAYEKNHSEGGSDSGSSVKDVTGGDVPVEKKPLVFGRRG